MTSSKPESKLLFRCSRLGDLISGSEGLTEIQKGKLEVLRAKQVLNKITDNQLVELGSLIEKQGNVKAIGKTTESYLKMLWMQNEFGYKEEVLTDEMMKGLLCEQDSFAIMQKVLGGEFRKKNTTHFKNDWIMGMPDIVLSKQDYVDDAKSSYNLKTFLDAESTKLYEWQLQGYMWLTGKPKARLIYCLTPTPENLIEDQKRRWYYKFNMDESNDHYIQIADQIQRNNDLINDIPAENRIKVFEYSYDPEKIELLKAKIETCREYYNSLTLPHYST